MRLKLLIGALLILQAVLLVHMVSQLSEGLSGLPTAAEGGTVAQVNLDPTTVWGGLYGDLTSDGNTQLSVTRMDIVQRDVRFNDSNNDCRKTELFASTSPVAAANIQPITPAAADALLGYSPQSEFSVSSMFDQQYVFDINGQAVTLWTTRTRGQLSEFIQGVAQANGQVVFVTITGRNTQAYNGDFAGYQFILPTGTWDVTFDAGDSCNVLDEYEQGGRRNITGNTRLDAAMPQRICTDQQSVMFAIDIFDRTFCSPAEVGEWWCQPVEGVEVTIEQEGDETFTTTSAEDGSFAFIPAMSAQHTLILRGDGQTVRRLFRTDACLDSGPVQADSRTIQTPGANVSLAQFQAIPGRETPGTVEVARIEFTLISVITMIIIMLGSIAYYESHKDSVELLLRMRIWLLERLR